MKLEMLGDLEMPLELCPDTGQAKAGVVSYSSETSKVTGLWLRG